MVTQSHIHYQRLSQRPVVTAHLAQTMSLLELNRRELLEKIHSELAENPALELVEEWRCPTCGRVLKGQRACPACSFAGGASPEEPVVFVSQAADFSPASPYREDDTPVEDFSAATEDLPTYVLRQIAAELRPADLPVAAMLLTSLDEDGLLTIPLVEVAAYLHVPMSQVENVQRRIMACDPLGVGSSSHQQALLVQLEALNEQKPVDPLAFQAVTGSLDLLARNHADQMARRLGIPLARARRLIDFISDNLNPNPASAYWGSARHNPSNTVQRYSQPDVVISCHDQGGEPRLQVEIVWPLRGTLRVNPEILAAARNAPPDKADDWHAVVERANLLVKCLSQRNHTLVRLMQELAVRQRDFILHGAAQMHPLTRAALAQKLDVHESTISRAVAGKAAQLPNGQIVPLSKFFDRSLNVRTVLRAIIAAEHKPLSDTRLAVLLAEQGFKVARRTVAKYRAMEGILPAHLRGKGQ
ncbi:MAG: hypothetical protein HYZ26_09950 [Chloroflexi bacterium]|nr:hypothetical protein [Chloroflexota bacterium]